MRSEFAFLFPKPAKKARKTAVKAIRVGASVLIFRSGDTATVIERDTRYKNAWFVEIDGKRAPYSFGRDDMKVL